MGILKEAGDSIMKYGEMLFHKTEELARIAKLNIDIKRFQLDIGIAEKDLGRFVLKKIQDGATSVGLSEAEVTKIKDKVDSLKAQIQAKRDEIGHIKSEAKAKKTESGA
jgi:phage shock protein A